MMAAKGSGCTEAQRKEKKRRNNSVNNAKLAARRAAYVRAAPKKRRVYNPHAGLESTIDQALSLAWFSGVYISIVKGKVVSSYREPAEGLVGYYKGMAGKVRPLIVADLEACGIKTGEA